MNNFTPNYGIPFRRYFTEISHTLKAKQGRSSEVLELTVDPIKRIFVSLSTYRISCARVTSAHTDFPRGSSLGGRAEGTRSKSWTFRFKIGRSVALQRRWGVSVSDCGRKQPPTSNWFRRESRWRCWWWWSEKEWSMIYVQFVLWKQFHGVWKQSAGFRPFCELRCRRKLRITTVNYCKLKWIFNFPLGWASNGFGGQSRFGGKGSGRSVGGYFFNYEFNIWLVELYNGAKEL